MPSKPPVLQNGPVSYAGTMAKIDELFTAHKLWLATDKLALARTIGPEIRCAFTSGHDPIAPEILDALPNLKLVACFGVGVDGVNVAELARRGIAVTNTPDVLTEEVADFAMALLLSTVRQIVKGDRYVRSGEWVKRGNMEMTWSLTGGKTLGIIGLGRIGKAIAKRASAFNLAIAYHGRSKQDVPYRYYADPVSLAKDVDILMAVTPGGPGTKHLVNAKALEALGPTGIFINVARGSVVDQPALVAALASGQIAAAGLDVFEAEPCVPTALVDMLDNVVLQPHQASASHETRGAMGDLMIANVQAFLAGKPLLTPVKV
ncbi:MAG: 2-hydroxyacid dehydrogenase [Alphaproteobacteria bacterium]|nr:2-hydroxyacid dehydrogenase [Alphaproteobacteria bacterium]